ncbi:putative clathrin assembly protein At4g40080 [Mercurialis annua]|uniref:putative clathrin assembly protein At4g40080 n=1 Tax=Mercurialis annua TaxID=3986 RepID=UPI00215EE720|nr:putative clathrin assembly protein At4g40080 [Mercurialis annua]
MKHAANLRLRDIIGLIKDKASQSKAAIISKPKTFSLKLSLLRATTHDPFTPPNSKHIDTILSYGHSSRATAAAAIEALMDRLQSTHDSSVAIKCLIIVHHIIKHGSFILQDQLSVYPCTGGRNYLKLSSFRDNITPLTWELSSWVRWYGRYLENLLSTSRTLGFILCSTSSTSEKDKEEEKVSALTNSDLLKELDSLSNLMEETSRRPGSLHLKDNELVDQIISLVGEDYLSSINEIAVRVDEFNQRLSCLSFADSVELVCVLKRLEDCKDKVLALSTRKKALVEGLWCLISEMKEKVGIGKQGDREDGRLFLTMGRNESARFTDRVLSYGNSVMFSSLRFG